MAILEQRPASLAGRGRNWRSESVWAGILLAFPRWLLVCEDRIRTREALAQMDAQILRDIGIRREDALAEARKPFWKS